MSNYILVDEGWLHELTDDDAALEEEMVPYTLIHALIKDICRLQNMVIETREKVNEISPKGEIYDLLCENVFNGIYYDLPAMDRYAELFGDEAIKLWEN